MKQQFVRTLLVTIVTGLATMALAAPAVAQPTLSKVFTPNTIGPGSVSRTTFTITNDAGSPVTELSFTDVLPVAITIADPANASTICNLGASGTLTAPDGGSTITLSDAQLAGGSSCTVTVDVTASTPGMHTNPAVTLSSSAGSSMSLPIDLTVVTTLPGFSKSFAPSSVPLGDRSTLTFTIDNSLNASNVTNLDFTDSLPVGMEIADPASASTTCGTAAVPPTLTADPGTTSIILDADGTFAFPAVADGATCTVTVDVTTTGTGMLDNVSNDLLAEFVSAGKASDTLTATITPLAIQKAFTDDPAPPGNAATLEFNLQNFDRSFPASGVAFTDDLTTMVPPLAGLTFSGLLSNDCGGTVSGVGGTTIGFSGGTIAAEGSCTIRVTLAVPAGATPGVYTNSTSTVTGTVDGSPVVGNMAADDLFVEPAPVLTKEFLEAGTLLPDPIVQPGDDVVIRFTVTNTSATSGATDVTFLDELTDGGPDTGFLPFPVSVTLPPVPDPPCSGGSALSLVSAGTDRQGLLLTGGSLAAAGMAGDSCTFDVTVTIPIGLTGGVYTNTTEEVTATVDGATRIGNTASDTLTVIAAPSLTKVFTDDPVAPGGTVTLEFTLSHNAEAATDATGISFTDDLAPVLAGLTANFPSSPDPPCGAGSTFTGSAGDTLLTLMGGTLMAGESCTFSVTLDVPAGAAAGSYTNTTSGVSATVSGEAATSQPASDVLDVAGLVFTKEFLGDPAVAGDTVTLRFEIENVHPTLDATITFFTDNLAGALAGLAATGGPTSDDCGGSLSGTTFLTYVGGGVLAGETCTIEVPVLIPLGSPDGSYNNVTSSLSANQGGAVAIAPAVDTLVVNSNLIALAKAFTDDPVTPGDPVTLEFTLTNLDASQTASAIAWSDDLGAALTGLTFDSVLFNDCGGTVAGTGTDMIDVSAVSLAAGASCTLRVSLTVPGAAAEGIYPNTTSSVTATLGGFPITGDPASDDLVVQSQLLFSKSFDGPTTATGTATLTFVITNPGASTAAGIGFLDDLDAVIPGLIATSLPAVPCGIGSSITGVSLLSFSGGELPPMGGMCSFAVDVLVPATATAGTFPNTTTDLTQAGLVVSPPATADLVIEPPPTFSKGFAPALIGLGQTSTLTFTIDNTASSLAASALDFTDNLPAAVAVVGGAGTDCAGGTITAVPGSGVIAYNGGTVAATASCTVAVDVTGTGVGAHLNTSGDLTSSSGNSGPASATLTVVDPPGFAKVFAPNPIFGGQVSTLTFTIDNTGSVAAATGLDFTDTLPASVVVAAPANASTTCTGGTITAVAGSGVISYSGGTVSAGATCTVQADVTSAIAGMHVNTTGNLTSSLGSSGTATDTLTVQLVPPVFSKAFAPDTIATGGTSTLSFLIDNSGSLVDIGNLDFTDNLPAPVQVANPANASTTCTGGTLTAVAGSGVISYSGGTVSAGATCQVDVDVTSSTDGVHTNVSGDLTSDAGSSGAATADLTVVEILATTKTFLSAPVLPGGFVDLEFTLSNPSSFTAVNIAFTDDLDAAVSGLAALGLPAADVCGAGSQLSGTSVITLTGGTLGPGASCTFAATLLVPGTAAVGTYPNTTSAVSFDIGPTSLTGAPATDDLDVLFLGFFKFFPEGSVLGGGTTPLSFTIENLDPVNSATGIMFTDDLDAMIAGAEAIDLPMSDVCGAGSLIDGTSLVTFTGGTLGPLETCTFEILVTVPGETPSGNYTNVTSVLEAMVNGAPVVGPAAAVAMADLLVFANPIAIPTMPVSGLLVLISLLAIVGWVFVRRYLG